MLKSIIGKLCILSAVYRGDGWDLVLLELIRHKKRTRIKMRSRLNNIEFLKNHRNKPFVLVVGGDGVISRSFAPGDNSGDNAEKRITGDPATFIYVRHPDGKLTFMRRDRFDNLIQQLKPYGLSLVSTRIDPDGNLLKEALEAGNEFFEKSLSVSELFRPTTQADLLSSLLTKKLMLPVLGSVLLILAANFFIQKSLQEQVQSQHSALAMLDKNNSELTLQIKQQEHLFSMLLPEMNYRYCFLADRIGSVVPQDVKLTMLSINPLQKGIQENKPLPLTVGINIIKIEGICPLSEPIAQLAEVLKSFGFAREIRMISLERDRTGDYYFEIDLLL